LIKDIRKDLKAPALPFVIGEFGIDGVDAGGWVATLRQQQADIAALPEFKATVRVAKTAHLWPSPPYDMSEKWEEFVKLGKINNAKSKDDPTYIKKFYTEQWANKYAKELAFTSDKRYHYKGSGSCYYQMGQSMGNAMVALLEGK
jgi:hypothetical protein